MSRKTIKDIVIDIQDEEYWYLTAFEDLDEEKRNDILRRLYHSAKRNDAGLALSNAGSLQIAIDEAVQVEAKRLHELPPSPFDHSFDEIMSGFPGIRSAA